MGKVYKYLVVFASAMGGFLFGYEVGIISQVLIMDDFGLMFGMKYRTENGTLHNYPEKADIEGWITFTFLCGCVIGAAASWVFADWIGRRYTIFIGSVFFMVGGAMQTGSSHIATLYVARIISGIGVGSMSNVVPLYISETAEADIRGRLTSSFQLMITFGILVASCVNAIILSTTTGDIQWRLALGMQLVPALVLWVLIIFMPFSPRWLLDRGREKEALVVLAKLRDKSPQSEELSTEFKEIKLAAEAEKAEGDASWAELFKPQIRKRLFIGVNIQAFQQLTGINVIMYYAAILFDDMGFSQANSSVTFVIVNAAINCVATLPGMWLVERIGRRLVMLIGGVLVAIAHFSITLFVGLTPMVPQLSWLAVISVYIFVISFAATWGPVVWVYQSEIFPMRCRAKGTACCTVSNWIWNAIVAKVAPIILAKISFYIYLIFGIFGIIMAFYAGFFVPETKGHTLEDMDEVFDHIVYRKKSASIAMSEKKAKQLPPRRKSIKETD